MRRLLFFLSLFLCAPGAYAQSGIEVNFDVLDQLPEEAPAAPNPPAGRIILKAPQRATPPGTVKAPAPKKLRKPKAADVSPAKNQPKKTEPVKLRPPSPPSISDSKDAAGEVNPPPVPAVPPGKEPAAPKSSVPAEALRPVEAVRPVAPVRMAPVPAANAPGAPSAEDENSHVPVPVVPPVRMEKLPHPDAAAPGAPPPPLPAEVFNLGEHFVGLLAFDTHESTLSEENKAFLRTFATELLVHENTIVRLIAYARGEQGTISSAQRLSLSRALAIRSYLMSLGIHATRIDVRARGNKTDNPEKLDAVEVFTFTK